MELTREYEAAMYSFVFNCLSMCIYALLFGAIIYIGDFGITTDKHFALSLILGFFAGLLNDIGRKIEFFYCDVLEEIKKADQVETAMEDLGKKIKAFSEMHKGKSADDILAEMRGEEPRQEDKPTTIKGINGNERENPNSAWSKEDENMLNRLILHFDWAGDYRFNKSDCDAAQDWLKDLKERYIWKPSEEQIKAVRLARSFVTDDFSDNPTLSEILTELEEQLKKLREK